MYRRRVIYIVNISLSTYNNIIILSESCNNVKSTNKYETFSIIIFVIPLILQLYA